MAWVISAKEITAAKRRINAYNKAVKKMWDSGLYAVAPLPTTFEQEMKYMTSKRRYNERMAQLGRALPSINRHAADVVTYHGFEVPRYMRDEVKNIVKSKSSEYKEMRKQFIPAWEHLSPQRRLAEQANKNYGDMYEEDYIDSPESYQELLDIEYPDVPVVAERYIEVWEDMNGDPNIPNIIRELAMKDPDGFMLLMESPDVEKDIEYIYPSSADIISGSHYTYKRQSAYKSPHQNRMAFATDYWYEQMNDFYNREGYFR